jgi:hypothetical protein
VALTEKQTLILWALLAKPGSASFQKDIKPEVTKADRDALITAGLITEEKRGRAKWIEATDKGWSWASEHLDAKLPRGSNAGSAILQAWLTRLKAFMLARSFALAEVLGPQPAATTISAEARVSTGSPEASPLDYAAVRTLVRHAYLDITGGRFNGRVLLRDIREKVKQIDRGRLDDALRRMQREQEALLYQLDNRTEVTEDDREAAIYFGSEPRHILWIEK